MKLTELKKYDWVNIWSGDWNLLDCLDWGEHYLTTLKIGNKPFLNKVVFIIKNGKSSCWVDANELKISSAELTKIYPNKTKINNLSHRLRRSVDAAMAVMGLKRKISKQSYNQYREAIRKYYIPHFFVKYIADSLIDLKNKEFLPVLQKARVYAEPVFAETLIFDKKMARQIGYEARMKAELMLCMTKDELNQYFDTLRLPSRRELRQRYKFSCLILNLNKSLQILTGKRAAVIEKGLASQKVGEALIGQPAYPGMATGKVLIISDPKRTKGFSKGDILVAGMTRPEYLPLMKKAAAFVTDAGGILSHAAIVSRELKKPCVIGTKIATKVFKDGDIVEVDANKGIIRKMK